MWYIMSYSQYYSKQITKSPISLSGLALQPNLFATNLFPISLFRAFQISELWIRNCAHVSKVISLQRLKKKLSSLLTHTVPCLWFYFWKHLGRINLSIEGRKVIELKEPLKYLVTQWGWSKDFLGTQSSSQPELWRGGCLMRLIRVGGTSLAVHRECVGTQESAYQCRGHVFDPWSGKMPHAVERLSPCTTTTELVLQSHGAEQEKPLLTQLQKAPEQR